MRRPPGLPLADLSTAWLGKVFKKLTKRRRKQLLLVLAALVVLVCVACAKMVIEATESSELPLFAVGDFNSTPSLFPHSQRTSQGENAMDLLIESDQFKLTVQSPPTQKEMTYPSDSPTRAIDWILIPRSCRFTSHRTIPSLLSDHRPLLADVQLPIEGE